MGINSPYYQFNADGSGTEKDNIGLPDQVLNFTYSVSNNIIILNYPAQPTQPYAYQVSLNIQKLTANEMVLLWDDTSPVNGSSQYKDDIDLTR